MVTPRGGEASAQVPNERLEAIRQHRQKLPGRKLDATAGYWPSLVPPTPQPRDPRLQAWPRPERSLLRLVFFRGRRGSRAKAPGRRAPAPVAAVQTATRRALPGPQVLAAGTQAQAPGPSPREPGCRPRGAHERRHPGPRPWGARPRAQAPAGPGEPGPRLPGARPQTLGSPAAERRHPGPQALGSPAAGTQAPGSRGARPRPRPASQAAPRPAPPPLAPALAAPPAAPGRRGRTAATDPTLRVGLLHPQGHGELSRTLAPPSWLGQNIRGGGAGARHAGQDVEGAAGRAPSLRSPLGGRGIGRPPPTQSPPALLPLQPINGKPGWAGSLP